MEPKRRYRYAWQITWAVRAAQVRRYVLLPLFSVLLLLIVALSGFVAWGYVTDTDFRGALEIVLSSHRASVFRDADIPALKQSQAKLALFAGNEQEAYQELLTVLPEDLSYISTGYCDENGSLLLGGFETSFSIQYGILHYRSFQGLYAASESGYHYIPLESCSPYAPAVLKLYRLSVFDG